MRHLSAGAMAVLLVWSMSATAETSGPCNRTLEAPLRSRAALEIESRAAGIEVVGTDDDVIRVSCRLDQPDQAEKVAVRIAGTAEEGKLTIAGSSLQRENLQIRVEVPRKMDLEIHMPAGQVSVENITGDKEIDLYAGQITIVSPDDAAYRSVYASVGIGEVKASAFGIDRGGFFRTFRRNTQEGEYRLYARVLTGEIDLE